MTIKDSEKIIAKLADKVKNATNSDEASQWAKCLQNFVTANTIHNNLKS